MKKLIGYVVIILIAIIALIVYFTGNLVQEPTSTPPPDECAISRNSCRLSDSYIKQYIKEQFNRKYDRQKFFEDLNKLRDEC